MKKFNKRQRIAENIAYTFLLCIFLTLLLATLKSSSVDIGYIGSPVVFGSVNDISIAMVSTIMVLIISYKLLRDIVMSILKGSGKDNMTERKDTLGVREVKHFNILIFIYVCFYLWYFVLLFRNMDPLSVRFQHLEPYELIVNPDFVFLLNVFLSVTSMVSAFFMLYFNRLARCCFTFIFVYWIVVSIFEEPVVTSSLDAFFGYFIGYSSSVILYLSWFSEVKTLFERVK
ncbi:hypothetical protein L2712_09700 [Shewanella marisflavi]|uniref:hypothetical protein n=1 Tax=Shewanella marisflavi TaxID=260364 RepID=UPI00200D5D8C|nr:hypothetical protein [Shewanella marisflavi]MCL1041910.1 hypothetical protein [Shewanella marisflavi]